MLVRLCPLMNRSFFLALSAAGLAFGLVGCATPSTKPVSDSSKPLKEVVTAGAILDGAQQAYARGDRPQALSLINQAIRAEPNNPRGYFARGRFYSTAGDSTKAAEDFTKSINLDPTQGDVYQLRGIEQFRLAHVEDSIQDFNRYLTLNPDQIAHHWQRGIAYYYADRFAEGRQQFELHQSVNPQDVENAAWHFFCVARLEGVEKARLSLMPIAVDSRIPMMAIHALLAGHSTPADVLAAASAGNPSPTTRQRQLFYANLYLGLYFEVMKEDKKSRECIAQAVQLATKEDYMGTAAKVHATIRKLSEKSK